MLSLGWGTITRPLRVSCCLPWLPTSRPLPRLLGRAFVMYTDRMFCFCFCLFVSFTTPQVPRVFPPAPPHTPRGGGTRTAPRGRGAAPSLRPRKDHGVAWRSNPGSGGAVGGGVWGRREPSSPRKDVFK